MRPEELRALSRDELIARAEALGVVRPRVLTQVELVDEIVRLTTTGERRERARGWLGKARDLLARAVERGLHLPDAAARFAGAPRPPLPRTPPPLPTVTLAEIYAAQGYLARALKVLDEVLEREPDHAEALRLRARLAATANAGANDGPPAAANPEATAPGSISDPPPPGTEADASVESDASASPADPPPEAAVAAASAPAPQAMKSDPPAAVPESAPPAPTPESTSPAPQASAAPESLSEPSVPDPGAGAANFGLTAPDSDPTTQPSATPAAARPAPADLPPEADEDSPIAEAELAPPARASMAEVEDLEGAAAELDAAARELETAAKLGATVSAPVAASASDDIALADDDAEPASYGVDEIVALAVDPTTAYIYWEVRPARFARARFADPKGKLVVRVLSAEVEHGHSTLRTWDNEVVPLAGDLFIRGLPSGSEVRLCIAWKGGEQFVPLAVAPELQMPHELLTPAEAAATPARSTAAPAAGAGAPPGEAPHYFADVASAPSRPSFEPRRGRLRPLAVTFGAGDQGGVHAAAGERGPEREGFEELTPGERTLVRRPAGVVRNVRRRLGGASDLYTEEELRQLEELGELSGPGRRRGGASDLFGGASDLSIAHAPRS